MNYLDDLKITLENGVEFYGKGICRKNNCMGEVVFCTSMTGYQEIITDPSYYGQFVVMTYPLIGNYGINEEDFESIKPHLNGLIVKELCEYPSHYKSHIKLSDYLSKENIPFIYDVDTRELTKVIRVEGTMRAMITKATLSKDKILPKILEANISTDFISKVTTNNQYNITGKREKIVVIDLGMKKGILNELIKRDFDITVVPSFSTFDEIRKLSPDKILLSNGPGDPKNAPNVINLVKELIPHYPIFGICLGHQIIALACGADTEKMKFGHRGPNHPVKNDLTNQVKITSQNHNYTIKKSSILRTNLEIIETASHDGSVEAIMHKKYPVVSVQYHPEGAPGPNDSNELFVQFLENPSGLFKQRRREKLEVL